jgi:hypothetical protein
MGFSKITKKINPKQFIEGYDYVPVKEQKGSLRREKQRQRGQDIYNDTTLSEDQKRFRLEQLINEEKIHQNKFKPDTERKNRLRERTLGKESDEQLEQRFDKRTDGNWYTKT